MTSALGAFVRDQNGRGASSNNDWEHCLECLLTLLHDDPVVTTVVGHASALPQQQQPEERLVAEMSALLLQPHSTTSATTTSSGVQLLLLLLPRDWIDALQLLSSRILPHLTAWQLHAVVTHSSLCLVVGEQHEYDASSQQQQQQQPHALFVPACLLLCAHSLHCCPNVITSRRARWKSLLWETIRLVQRLVAVSSTRPQQRIVVLQQDPSSSQQDSNVDASSANITNATVVVHHHVLVSPHRLLRAVWQSHLVEALVHTYHALLQSSLLPDGPAGRPTIDQRWDAVVCAAVVRTTAQLATRGWVATAVDYSQEAHYYHHSVERLVACLHGITAEPLEALLGMHPWRKKQQQQKQASTAIRKPTTAESSFSSWLTYYTTTTTTLLEDDDNDWCGLVETTWHDVTTGIALLVAGTWSQRPSGVWTGAYQWQLYFPHVSCLLLGGPQSGDDDMDLEEQSEQDDDNDDPGAAAAAAAARCQCEMGYTLLQQLLELMPRHSLDIAATKSHPLHPAGTFQLLLNHMMISPPMDRPNDSTKQQQQQQQQQKQQQQQQLRAHRCVRDLLSKYQPYAQFRLVKDLIQSCPPHLTPTIVPKLVDLWRPLMVRQQSWRNDCHDNNTDAATAQRAAAAIQQVWWFLDEQFLQPMDGRHVEILVKSSSSQPSNSPTGGGQGDNIVAVKDIEGLLSLVEIYGAVLGLYQLYMKLHHEPVVVAHDILSQRLDRMHRAIAYTMQQHWSDHHAPPLGELFRLHLLQDGLGQTLELLHQMGSSS